MDSTDNSPNQTEPSTPGLDEHGGIRELMLEPEHDLAWLTRALQMAIKLEHATLPPYLCAIWSIKNTGDPVHDTIRKIVVDEMFHMGLACNLLTTIGGTPILHDPQFIPKYPGRLPGGVRPGLTVTLAGLSRPQIERVFMEIEMPEAPIALAEEYPTIGKFYNAIQAAFGALPPRLITGRRQIVDGDDLFAINSYADASQAIEKIKREGEGTKEDPCDDRKRMAHYYAFKEILVGKRLKRNDRGKWGFTGDTIPFPDAYPMATVPAGGYDLPESAAFDRRYTSMLKALEDAWGRDGGSIDPAVKLMFQLRELARVLIAKERAPEPGNYGPSFGFRPA